jgi:hypothetical protein
MTASTGKREKRNSSLVLLSPTNTDYPIGDVLPLSIGDS